MTIARDIARSVGSSVRAGNIGTEGAITGQFSATIYDSTTDLPTSGVERGAQGYVSSNQRLYIRGTGGWYNIATINNTPTINSVQTAGGDSSPFELATDGSTTTVITINATDSEGFPITFSAVTDVGFDSIATVTNDSSVFTITPFSEDSVGTATSGTITFKASDGVNVASEVATFTLTFRIDDSNFTTVLMKASGNNGTNTTINDASSNTHTITVNGNAAAQAFTPYHSGGYSAYFDGSGDYLTVADDNSLDVGTGDFTVECWIYLTADDGTYNILSHAASGGMWLGKYSSGFVWRKYGVADVVTATSAPSTNRWHHIAVTRSSSSTKMFIDGVQTGSTASDTANYTVSASLYIGDDGDNSGSHFNGYISDLRIVKGTAVYTANFTSPTKRLTAITNTSLLTCHLPYFADGSSVGHSITINGNTHTERFGPYDYLNYNASSHGASVYFDGSGDYLKTPSDSSFNLNNTDFTIEGWFYATAPAGNEHIWSSYIDTNNRESLYFTNSTTLNWFVNGSNRISATIAATNNWHHVAIVDNSGTTTMYINGVSQGTWSSTYTDGNRLAWIGNYNDGGYAPDSFTGFISDVRVVKGTAVYTSAFTPPTSPLSAITNTSLLTCNDAPNVFDANGSTRVNLSGVTSANSNTKYSDNIVLDGGSERVYFYPTSGSYHNDVKGDFTVETWIKLESNNISYPFLWVIRNSANTGGPRIIARFGDSGFGYHLQFELNGSGVSNVYSVNLTQSNFNNYKHVALTRSNGNVRCFVNGTQYSFGTGADPSSFPSNTITFNNNVTSINQLYIGNGVDGQMEDFRFTNGLARYTSNFTPPTEELKG